MTNSYHPSDCPFCNHIIENDEKLIVYQDNHIVVIPTLEPASIGHILVLTRIHIQNLWDLPDELSEPLISVVKLMAVLTKDVFKADGVSLRQNNEWAAGQRVFHFHLHVLPRFLNVDDRALQPKRVTLEERYDVTRRLKAGLLR